MNPVDQFPRTRCPRWSHLTWNVREGVPFDRRRGPTMTHVGTSRSSFTAPWGHTTRVARSRGLKAARRTCHLRVRGTTIGFTVSKIANDEIPPYQRTATLFSDLKHISCSSSSAAKLLAHSSRHKHDIVHRLKFPWNLIFYLHKYLWYFGI